MSRPAVQPALFAEPANFLAEDRYFDSDPAIRWQAMRDLTDASPATIAAERGRVAHEGIGAQVLTSQGADGPWHRGAPTARSASGTCREAECGL